MNQGSEHPVNAPLLNIQNLSISFATANGSTNAVKDLSLSIRKGEVLALVGESGSGKSVTSLSILRLLPSPPAVYNDGKILLHQPGHQTLDILKADKKTLETIRGNRVAMIFQEPMSALNPVMRCGRQVMESLRKHQKLSNKEARQKTLELFARVKLPEPELAFRKYPHQMSGGQKQRVMIAIAICCEPDLLICDEPTTALDVTVQKAVLQLIKELQREKNMGVLFITHDLGVVAEIAERVAIMYKGEIVEENSVREIFSHPAHPYTKALIACRPAGRDKSLRLPVVSDFTSATNTVEIQIPKAKVLRDEAILSVQNLVVRYPASKNFFGRAKSWFYAVDDVSFDIYKGETLGLVGESGCGKTTLGRAILRLTQPSSGSILMKENDVTHLSEKEFRKHRKDVQLVFQDPYASLNPKLTVGDAISEPLEQIIKLHKRDRNKRLRQLLDQVGLPDTAAGRYPHEFSGGQRQRIVIARALALDPGLLVCDESVSALDVSVQAQVLNLLNELKAQLGLTMLFISHDLSVVRYMCDRIMVMKQGRIIESGPADEVYYHPQSHYTKELISAIPTL